MARDEHATVNGGCGNCGRSKKVCDKALSKDGVACCRSCDKKRGR